MNLTTFTVKQASGPKVEAVALVNPAAFSPRYDLDRVTGTFSRTGHPLYGHELAGNILASVGVQGGVAGGWAFLAMKGLDVGPAGLIFGSINPVMVQGAVTARLPIVAGIDPMFFVKVKTGDVLRIDPTEMSVTLLKPVV